jgi:hypothetical protein
MARLALHEFSKERPPVAGEMRTRHNGAWTEQ